MDAWIDIRRKARQCHERALESATGDRRAGALVSAALRNEDLHLRPFEKGTRYGDGVYGVLERENRIVNVLAGLDPDDQAVIVAHEIGHFVLHRDPTSEVTMSVSGLGGDIIDSGAGKVEGYSPRERKEVQADIFAGEFLCPSAWLRDQFVIGNRRPAGIAQELGLPTDLVMAQMIRAVLLPPLRDPPPMQAAPVHELDESQKIAATWDQGALLVDAGPGTGKTRTLVHRVSHLLGKGAMPGSILALTFSVKAAEEMRDRLSGMNADAAIEMWVSTFHAFGLELIVKWPNMLKRTSKVRILDQAGSLALLEANLERLPLRHYQNLYEPAYELVNVLRAISRCKDELIAPAQYLKEAQAALVSATDDEEREAAEKAIEVAEVYRVYEDALVEADAVDFGDLVMLPITLVQKHPEVKEHVARYRHLLVDEYQDVNHASAALLRAIAQAGTDVWVVADQRQSIYRFRGAAPDNVQRFTGEFSGTRQSLTNNYRSYAPIVQTFQRFSTRMGGGKMAGVWNAVRAAGGGVSLTVAPSLAAEAEAIRERIEDLRVRGVPYGDQALLGRTHLTIARLTGILEQLRIPLLYLGDLFERDEIRTLLSLLAIDAEPGGIGLVRVATLPEYGATREDALAVIHWAEANRLRIGDALKRVTEIDGLSSPGRAGLSTLAYHLDGLQDASPWTLLTEWLFERSNHLRGFLSDNDPRSQQVRIAIYHLLKVCAEQAGQDENTRQSFLARVRRIEALNFDSSYRAVASEAADIDAVRVMTIHGSKGLEFSAVHFPGLATRYMPTTRQANRCPPPPTLAHLAVQKDGHDAEEESLFFVALSRARDFLCLTRAERYTTQNATPSKFISLIEGIVPTRRHDGTGQSYGVLRPLQPQPPSDRYDERDLATYLKCPARYRYAVLERLHGARDDSAYVRFHRCVYVTVRWIEAEREAGRLVDAPEALERLAGEWLTEGPIGHAFEGYYRKAAHEMVTGMAEAVRIESGTYERAEWLVSIAGRKVAITPDRVLITPQGTVRVQRIRTGRETKSEPGKAIYALLRRGAAIRYPGRTIRVEIFYLGSGNVVPVEPRDDDKLLQEYAEAIAAIERGEFDPSPDMRTCPNCPAYFLCPA